MFLCLRSSSITTGLFSTVKYSFSKRQRFSSARNQSGCLTLLLWKHSRKRLRFNSVFSTGQILAFKGKQVTLLTPLQVSLALTHLHCLIIPIRHSSFSHRFDHQILVSQHIILNIRSHLWLIFHLCLTLFPFKVARLAYVCIPYTDFSDTSKIYELTLRLFPILCLGSSLLCH